MPRGVRHAILKKLFKVQNCNAMFSDAIHHYYADATAATIIPKRKGQLMYGKSGSTEKIYIAKVGSDTGSSSTGTAAWTSIEALGG